MQLYIQMGHQMQGICRDLSILWGGSTTILSPLNIEESKLQSFSQSLRKINGNVLLDPQLYSPRKHHKKLQEYSYWPQSGITSIEHGDYGEVLLSLCALNEKVKSDAFILPSQTTNRIDGLWDRHQSAVSNQARKFVQDKQLIHTIALSRDILSDDSQVENIIQYAGQWDVDGVYIVCEHPERYYLIDKPLWVANLLALVAGIKRIGKSVIVGYASHQMLCLALSKCDAIAAGNFLNVRWFQPERFETNDNNEPSRRAKWYYCPQAFSEYKVTFLDVAKRYDAVEKSNLLASMAPTKIMENIYSRILFEGAMPSSTGYSETDSHRHYLHCLKVQCNLAAKTTYEETRDAHLALLETATQLTAGLHRAKIKGQARDFSEIVDVIEAAISVFDSEFGYVLSREWDSM